MLEGIRVSEAFDSDTSPGTIKYPGMKKAGFNQIPLILGLVLGTMVEQNIHRALIISGGSYSIFYASTISKILIIITILSLVCLVVRSFFGSSI